MGGARGESRRRLRRSRRRRVMVLVAGAAAAVGFAGGAGPVGAVVRFAVDGTAIGGGGGGNITYTTSSKHTTTTQRVDLEDAPAPACDFVGEAARLVDSTTTDLDPLVTTTYAVGPTTIYIGDERQTPFEVAAGNANYNTDTEYHRVVTDYYQAVAAGDPCAAVLAARFTG